MENGDVYLGQGPEDKIHLGRVHSTQIYTATITKVKKAIAEKVMAVHPL